MFRWRTFLIVVVIQTTLNYMCISSLWFTENYATSQFRSRWRSLVSAYPHGKKAWVYVCMYVCMHSLRWHFGEAEACNLGLPMMQWGIGKTKRYCQKCQVSMSCHYKRKLLLELRPQCYVKMDLKSRSIRSKMYVKHK